jgi:peptide/nickel transport system substrate-binding protein
MIVNVNVVNAKGDQAFNLDPTGAGVGAFELVKFVPNESVEMKGKTDYYGGPVCIDTLRFTVIADETARYEALKLGEIGGAVLAVPRTVHEARDVDKRPGLVGYGNNLQFMVNARPGSPGENPLVRQAVAAAIDPDIINQRVNDGTATSSRAIVHPDTALYTPGMEGPQPDPAQAKQLVEQAKAAGWDGNIRLQNSDTPAAREISLTAQGMLQAAGMNVELTNVPVAEHISRVTTEKNFDIASWSLNVLPEAPWSGIDRNLRSDSPTNRTGYANAEFDAALAKLRAATTVDQKKAALAEVQEVWNATAPGVMFQQDEEFLTWGDKVHGMKLTREGVAMLDDVWIEK